MKNRHLEKLRCMAKQYHRNHPWKGLDRHGIYCEHDLAVVRPMSWWCDFGFVYGGCRVMVWWIHPRQRYADEIENRARAAVGVSSIQEQMFKREAVYEGLGRSRKRIKAYRVSGITAEQQARHSAFSQMKKRLEAEGIDFIVHPEIHMQRYPWGLGVDLCAPVELRNIADLRALAELAQLFLRRETTVREIFEGHAYCKQDWLQEKKMGDEAAAAAGNELARGKPDRF